MKKIISVLFVVCLFFQTDVLCRPKANTDNYDIYILIGQSNMAGRGKISEYDRGSIQNVFLLNNQNLIEKASVPLNKYSTVRKSLQMQGINPGYSFAKKISSETGRKILLIVNARGGTTLEEWMKGYKSKKHFDSEIGDEPEWDGRRIPSLYKETVRKARKGMKYGNIKAILWHQGEGNSNEFASKKYLDKLKVLVEDLRKDLGNENIPFVAGEIYEGYRNAGYFNPELQKISEKIDNAYWVSSKGCGSNPDKLHFSREGQILLGERYADIILEIIYGIKTQ